MNIVTRKIVDKPSNSKSPGGTHHVEISGLTFSCTADQRGTGWATAEIDSETATIEIAATFRVGKAGKTERVIDTADVYVTGDQDDTVILCADYTSSQSLRVEFCGVQKV